MYSANETSKFQRIQKFNSWIIMGIEMNCFSFSQKISYILLLSICGSIFLHQLILCIERYNRKETSIQIEMTRWDYKSYLCNTCIKITTKFLLPIYLVLNWQNFHCLQYVPVLTKHTSGTYSIRMDYLLRTCIAGIFPKTKIH